MSPYRMVFATLAIIGVTVGITTLWLSMSHTGSMNGNGGKPLTDWLEVPVTDSEVPSCECNFSSEASMLSSAEAREVRNVARSRRLVAHVSTDRAVYEPGDTLYGRIWHVDPVSKAPPASWMLATHVHGAQVDLLDPRSNVVWTGRLGSGMDVGDRFGVESEGTQGPGVVSFAYEIPRGVSGGEYKLRYSVPPSVSGWGRGEECEKRAEPESVLSGECACAAIPKEKEGSKSGKISGGGSHRGWKRPSVHDRGRFDWMGKAQNEKAEPVDAHVRKEPVVKPRNLAWTPCPFSSGPQIAPAERTIQIRVLRPRRLLLDASVSPKGLSEGDRAKISVRARQATGEVVVRGYVVGRIVVGGEVVEEFEGRTDVQGVFQKEWTVLDNLPPHTDGDASVSLSISFNGITETISSPLPLAPQNLHLHIYPESGDLVQSLPGRLYLQATSAGNEPVAVQASVCHIDGGECIATTSSQIHQGRTLTTSFIVPPTPLEIRILQPSSLSSLTFPVPVAKEAGAHLHAPNPILTPSEELVLHASCSHRASLAMRLWNKERLVSERMFECSSPDQIHKIQILTPNAFPPIARGVLRATLAEKTTGLPLAERLVFVADTPAHPLQVTTQHGNIENQVFAPGQTVTITVKSDGPSMLAMRLVDEGPELMLDPERLPPRLPAQVWIEPEVESFLRDSAAYTQFFLKGAGVSSAIRSGSASKLDNLRGTDFTRQDPSADIDSRIPLDLLLGTQGWRRFAYFDLVEFLGSSLHLRAGRGDPKGFDVQGEEATLLGVIGAHPGIGGGGGGNRKPASPVGEEISDAKKRDERAARVTGIFRPEQPHMHTMRTFGGGMEKMAMAANAGMAFRGGANAEMAEEGGAAPDMVLAGEPMPMMAMMGENVVEEATAAQDFMVEDAAENNFAGGDAPPEDIFVGGDAPPNNNKVAPEMDAGDGDAIGFAPMMPPMGFRQKQQVVRNVVSRIFAHSHAHRQTSGAAVSEGIDRSDFARTLLWTAGALTDEDGVAVFRFDLPDTITSFRLEIDSLTHPNIQAMIQNPKLSESDPQPLDASPIYNSFSASFVSKRPVYLEAKLPRTVSQGDQISVPVTMRTDTDLLPSSISGILRVSAESPLQASTPRCAENLPPNQPVNIHTTIGKLPPPSTTLQRTVEKSKSGDWLATAAGEKAKESWFNVSVAADSHLDALSQRVSVYPRGFPVQVARGVELRMAVDGGATVELPVLPEGVDLDSVRVEGALFPTPAASLAEALGTLLDEPCGCFEQTSATVYPVAMALHYFETHGVTGELVDKASGILARGYAKLAAFEVENGGFEWFGQAPAHEALSAYGALEFLDVARVWDGVDADVLERLKNWLLARRDSKGGFLRNERALDSFGSAKPATTDAYILWALTSPRLLRDGSSEPLVPIAHVSKEVECLASLLQLEGAGPVCDPSRAESKPHEDAYVTALALAVFSSSPDDGHKSYVSQLTDRLLKWQSSEDSMIRGPTQATSITSSGPRDADTEATAISVLALLSASSTLDQHRTASLISAAERAVSGILQRNSNGRFGATQATVLALKAITAVDAVRAASLVAGARVAVSVSSSSSSTTTPSDPIATIVLPTPSTSQSASDASLAGLAPIRIPSAAFREAYLAVQSSSSPSKSVQVKFTVLLPPGSKASDFPLPASITLSYRSPQPSNPIDATPPPFTLETSLTESTLQEGAATNVHVTITGRRPVSNDIGQVQPIITPMTVAIIGLPAGLRPDHDAIQRIVRNGDTGMPDFVETRNGDREIVLYWRQLQVCSVSNCQSHHIPLPVLADTPGTFQGPASRAYLYYDDAAAAWSPPLDITITSTTPEC